MAFKLKSGNSPLKDLEKRFKGAASQGAKAGYKKGGSMKNFFGAVAKDPMLIPTTFGKSLKHTYQKYIRKDPRGKLTKNK
tara:strand:+ start:191 stop:430 length:240 start_codon:yes stop_codon:yes gene_type:complete